MIQAINVRRTVHPPLSSALPHPCNSDPLRSADALHEQLMKLEAGMGLPDTSDSDVTIAVLEGCGDLTLANETVALEPGTVVFIPAQTHRTLHTQTCLTLLLLRGEHNAAPDESAWVVRF